MEGAEDAVFAKLIHRSSTPVLLYLQSIENSGGASPVEDYVSDDAIPPNPKTFDPTDPAFAKLSSEHGSNRQSYRPPSQLANSYRAPSHPASRAQSRALSQAIHSPQDDLDQLGNEELSYEDNDAASNEQQGRRSAPARSDNGDQQDEEQDLPEPSPNDPPGPRYESLGSSFGNLGPPRESFFGPPPSQPAWMTSATPSRAAHVPLPPESEWMSPKSAARSFVQPPPSKGRKPSLTSQSITSPKTVNIDIQAPSDPSRVPSYLSRAPSRQSHRSSGTAKHSGSAEPRPVSATVQLYPDGSMSIKIPPSPTHHVETNGKAPTEKALTEKARSVANDLQSPLSPRSKARSRIGTERGAAPSVAGTRYPELPDSDSSQLLSPEMQARSVNGNVRAPSKAPSKVPSKAASRAPSKLASDYVRSPERRNESLRSPESPVKSFGGAGPDFNFGGSNGNGNVNSGMLFGSSAPPPGFPILGNFGGFGSFGELAATVANAQGNVNANRPHDKTPSEAVPLSFDLNYTNGHGQTDKAPSEAQSRAYADSAFGRIPSNRAPSVRQAESHRESLEESLPQDLDRDMRGSAFGGDQFDEFDGRRSAAGGPPRSMAGSARTGASQRQPQPSTTRSRAASRIEENPSQYARSKAMSPTNMSYGGQSARRTAASGRDGTPTQSRVLSPDMNYENGSQAQARASSRSRVLSPESKRERESNAPSRSRLLSPEPEPLNEFEEGVVRELLNSRTPRTSIISPSVLEAEVHDSHFHDQDLCILLHAAEDEMAHEVVKRAVRKAVQQRIKKLGMKYDKESIKNYRKSFHDHDPSWHEHNRPTWNSDDPPPWVLSMMEKLALMEQRVAELGPQLARLNSKETSKTRSNSHGHRGRVSGHSLHDDDYETTPRQKTLNMEDGTIPDASTYRHHDTEYNTIPGESVAQTTIPGSIHHHDGSTHGDVEHDEFEDDDDTQGQPRHAPYTPTRTASTRDDFRKARGLASSRGESPGQQVLEEELYKLRIRDASQSAPTHRSWEIARESEPAQQTNGSEMPEIDGDFDQPDDHPDERTMSPPLPPIPTGESRDVVETQSQVQHPWTGDWNQDTPPTPPWQRIHQRLLNWAIVWPVAELDTALNSTLRGNQVDEVALSIWSTQMYKRYVRQQLTEVPPGRVDRLFVPPNMADAINNAVFHGRHGDACGMLRDLWNPFGLEGMPRIIVVLCKHRTDPSHWVAHKFSLPDGTLTTYDTYPEKCLPDGRPLGWWFAIRIAWPGAMYPSPDHLMQKMVRLHRPMQLPIDNSVAAAGIWRNLLMGSRAERPVDLERLRDLINTEVKNLRLRKEQGKLSVAAAIRPNWNWEEMGV